MQNYNGYYEQGHRWLSERIIDFAQINIFPSKSNLCAYKNPTAHSEMRHKNNAIV